MQRCAIILNGISRRKKKFYSEIYPALALHYTITVLETMSAGHATVLAAYAATEKFDFILAAGGDGTLNQVLNGVLQNSLQSIPPIGLIPLGSGNDFARAAGLSDDPAAVLTLLSSLPKPTDLGQLDCRAADGGAVTRYYVNACSVGMGPDVVQRLEGSRKSFGPGITYIISILTTFLAQKLCNITCSFDDYTWTGKARVVALANGRSFGHAVYIAPDAALDDGQQNIFIAGNFAIPIFLWFLLKLKSGKKIRNENVIYRNATTVKISSDEKCAIETEGELAGFLPATLSTHPGKILFFR